jgi:hypothetical protein
VPAIVSVAPPASVVTVGLKLATVKLLPNIVGAPRPKPHSEERVIN